MKALLLVLSSALYLYMGYFLERSNTWALFLCWFGLFGLSYALYRSKLSNQHLLYAGIGFRLLFMLALPTLSDDYFRFIWDGRLLANGINPFLDTPKALLANEALMAKTGLSASIYNGLNSPEYYSIYPPVPQLFFALAAYIAPAHALLGHVIVIRLGVLLAEGISLFYALRLLKHWNIEGRNVVLYWLNPLIIIEFTGNLHSEAWMVAGIAMGIYYLSVGKIWQGSLGLSISILAKFLPLMLLPLLLRAFGWKRAFMVYALLGLMLLATLSPFINIETALHLFSSIRLYFQKFEFNASVFYIVREIGYQFVDYNIIEEAGKVMPAIVLTIILGISFSKTQELKGTMAKVLWIFLVYLLFAHTVHPWYVGILAFAGMFTQHRFPYIWTCAIGLTYYTYRSSAYIEDLRLVGLEYGVLLCALLFDWYMARRRIAVGT